MSSAGPQQAGARFWAVIEAAALVTYVAFSFLFALTIPLGTGPDEEGHAAYAESLATGQGLPLPGESLSRRGTHVVITPQAHHPPLYYALLVPVYLAAPTYEHFLLDGRVLSIILGLGGVLLVRAAGRRVGLERPAIALGLVVLAAFATFSVIMGQLNNEALAVLVVGLSVYACARFLEGGSARMATLALGGILGLALLSKLTATVALVPLTAGVIAASRRAGPGRSWRWRAAGRVALGYALAGAIAAPWFAHNLAIRGALVYNSSYRPFGTDPEMVLGDPWLMGFVSAAVIEEGLTELTFPNWLARSYVPRLAAASGPTPRGSGRPWWYDALMLAFWGVPLVGLRRWRRAGDPAALPARRLAAVAAAVVAATLLGVISQALFVDYLIVRWAPRYTPVFLPALALVLGIGWHAFLPPRARPAGAVVLLSAAVAVCAVSLSTVASIPH